MAKVTKFDKKFFVIFVRIIELLIDLRRIFGKLPQNKQLGNENTLLAFSSSFKLPPTY